jgi:hypothetical protein
MEAYGKLVGFLYGWSFFAVIQNRYHRGSKTHKDTGQTFFVTL